MRILNFRILPHEVWIDTKGIVRAITFADEITYESLKNFINNKSLSLPEKVDDISFDISEPLKVADDAFLYRSILTHYKPGLMNTIGAFTLALCKRKEIKQVYCC